MDIKINNWQPERTLRKYLKEWSGFSMIVNGMSKSGKSYLVKDIITPIIDEFDFIIVFSKTLCNGFYSKWLKTKLLFDDFIPEVVEKFKELVEKYKNLPKGKAKNIKLLFIVDDCLSTSIKYENMLGSLFMTGRHFNASVIIIGQKASMYSLSWMCNCTIFISLYCGSYKEKKYISENIIADAIDGELNTLTQNKTSNSHFQVRPNARRRKNTNLKMCELFRYSYLAQTQFCKDYNSLVILPMEEKKIYQYKAPNSR